MHLLRSKTSQKLTYCTSGHVWRYQRKNNIYTITRVPRSHTRNQYRSSLRHIHLLLVMFSLSDPFIEGTVIHIFTKRATWLGALFWVLTSRPVDCRSHVSPQGQILSRFTFFADVLQQWCFMFSQVDSLPTGVTVHVSASTHAYCISH